MFETYSHASVHDLMIDNFLPQARTESRRE